MIKVLQQKLMQCGYVTNAISDKNVRHEITLILQEGLRTYGNNIMLVAVERFAQIYEERSGDKIMKKVPYFKKVFQQTLDEALLPNNEFEEVVINDATIKQTIIAIIERAVILTDGKTAYNPLKEKTPRKSPHLDIPDNLYIKAHEMILDYDYFFEPLIERALAINEGFEGSVKEEVEAIYDELEKFTEEYALEKFTEWFENLMK